ncbi:fimbrial biogenesis usher protein [Pseudomonas sp. MDT1-17]
MATLGVSVTASPAVASSVSQEQSPPRPSKPQIQFDPDRLRQSGIDPKVAAFFSQKPRFTQGIRRITLWVNGISRGAADARFDAVGQLCVTPELLDQGNLKDPAGQDRQTLSDGAQCLSVADAFTQAEVELRPSREEVSLVISAEALRPPSEDLGTFGRGGTAGLLNYEVMGSQNQYAGMSSRYTSANTALGFNAGDWLVRSRQIFTEQDGARNFQALYTYAQKTFVSYKSMLQVGEINIANSVFPGTAISGLQVLPDNALQGQTRSGATVEGIAQSQARVEIRQSGVLIHTTLVPAGPFRLPGVQLINGNTDLDVRVIEANGEQRNFTVPAASLTQFSYTAPGYSMAMGKVRTFGSDTQQSPTVVTGTGGWLLSPKNKLSAGLMASQSQYQATAVTLNSVVTAKTSLNLRGTLVNAGKEDKQGAEVSLGASIRVTEKLSASANVTRRTESFRDLLSTTQDHSAGYRHGGSREQYGASLSWSDPLLGGFSTGYSAATSFTGDSSQHLTGAWGKSFKHFSVSANLERSMSSTSKGASHSASNSRSYSGNSDAVYLSVSVPLGSGRNLRTYANERDGRTRFGTSFNDSSNDIASYQLGADSNTEDRQRNFSASMSAVPRYTSLSLGYSKSGEDSTTYSGQMAGGLVLHGDGLTLSPYPLRDTFALAKVGEVSGVKLSTPSGPVWTDPWGRAVVSQLNAYQTSRIEIATKTLPRNVDIQNGFKAVAAGRGSVHKVDFPVITTRRVLLRARDGEGKILPKGAGVFNAQDQVLATVVDSGKIFLANDQLSERLRVRLDNAQSCQLEYSLPDKADPNVYFESADAVCKPL